MPQGSRIQLTKYKNLTVDETNPNSFDSKKQCVIIDMGNNRTLDLPFSTYMSGRRVVEYEPDMSIQDWLEKMNLSGKSAPVSEQVFDESPSVQQ